MLGEDSDMASRACTSIAPALAFVAPAMIFLGIIPRSPLSYRSRPLPPRLRLAIAARKGHNGVVRLLLDAGANIDAQSDVVRLLMRRYQRSLLICNTSCAHAGGHYGAFSAAMHGFDSVVTLLTEGGADMMMQNVRSRRCHSRGSPGVYFNHAKVVAALCEAGADANAKDKVGVMARGSLFPALQRPLAWQVQDGNTPLTCAALKNASEAVVAVIAAGASVEEKNNVRFDPGPGT